MGDASPPAVLLRPRFAGQTHGRSPTLRLRSLHLGISVWLACSHSLTLLVRSLLNFPGLALALTPGCRRGRLWTAGCTLLVLWSALGFDVLYDSMSFKYEEMYRHTCRTRSASNCCTVGCLAAGLAGMLWLVTGTVLACTYVNCHPHPHLRSCATLVGRQQQHARCDRGTVGTHGCVICLPPCALSFQMVRGGGRASVGCI